MWHEMQAQFPILQQRIKGHRLVYLDSAATTQKPKSVIDRINFYYSHENANVHRGVYTLSERATNAYENVRDKVKQFINASNRNEIVFTRSATEAINLVAFSFGELAIFPGDEILISTMEHHSNIVPWQLLAERKGAILKVIPIFNDGTLDLEAYQNLLTDKVKIVALTHVSNVLGIINPLETIIALASQKNIPILIDGSQAVSHLSVDVQQLNCDFYIFSSHKMYGPTGAGVLYAKAHWLNQMPPYQGGGDMIQSVAFEKTTFNEIPYKFEAGTPSIAAVVGLGAAIDFIQTIDIHAIKNHEQQLMQTFLQALAAVPNLRILGSHENKASVISFVMENTHPHDIATILDNEGVAVRAGHHCAMPLMKRLNLMATVRISFAVYNTEADLTPLLKGLEKVAELFYV